MTEFPQPADVVRAVCEGVCRLVCGRLDHAQREAQLDQLAGLYAEHTNVRHPFSIRHDIPLRTRAELRHHFAAIGDEVDGIDTYRTADFRPHQTSDPEVVVTEFRYEGSSGGRPFSLPCIFVTRVRDGEIVESRDYGDSIAAARAFGQLASVADSLTAESRTAEQRG